MSEKLRAALERIANDSGVVYMSCPGVPFCRPGKGGSHDEECAVRIAREALAARDKEQE